MEALVGPLTERRRAVRHRRGLEEGGLLQVRIRSGHPAVLLNISAGGALLESESRSAPGTAIELIFEERDRQFAIKGRVLRSAVTRVISDGVSYEIAVAFDSHLWSPTGPGAGYLIPTREGRMTGWIRADATQSIASPGSDRVD